METLVTIVLALCLLLPARGQTAPETPQRQMLYSLSPSWQISLPVTGIPPWRPTVVSRAGSVSGVCRVNFSLFPGNTVQMFVRVN